MHLSLCLSFSLLPTPNVDTQAMRLLNRLIFTLLKLGVVMGHVLSTQFPKKRHGNLGWNSSKTFESRHFFLQVSSLQKV